MKRHILIYIGTIIILAAAGISILCGAEVKKRESSGYLQTCIDGDSALTDSQKRYFSDNLKKANSFAFDSSGLTLLDDDGSGPRKTFVVKLKNNIPDTIILGGNIHYLKFDRPDPDSANPYWISLSCPDGTIGRGIIRNGHLMVIKVPGQGKYVVKSQDSLNVGGLSLLALTDDSVQEFGGQFELPEFTHDSTLWQQQFTYLMSSSSQVYSLGLELMSFKYVRDIRSFRKYCRILDKVCSDKAIIAAPDYDDRYKLCTVEEAGVKEDIECIKDDLAKVYCPDMGEVETIWKCKDRTYRITAIVSKNYGILYDGISWFLPLTSTGITINAEYKTVIE